MSHCATCRCQPDGRIPGRVHIRCPHCGANALISDTGRLAFHVDTRWPDEIACTRSGTHADHVDHGSC